MARTCLLARNEGRSHPSIRGLSNPTESHLFSASPLFTLLSPPTLHHLPRSSRRTLCTNTHSLACSILLYISVPSNWSLVRLYCVLLPRYFCVFCHPPSFRSDLITIYIYNAPTLSTHSLCPRSVPLHIYTNLYVLVNLTPASLICSKPLLIHTYLAFLTDSIYIHSYLDHMQIHIPILLGDALAHYHLSRDLFNSKHVWKTHVTSVCRELKLLTCGSVHCC
ncbi:hypothetical protein BC835DRAFT_727228 [Cytidiella melzeri]|nr:hypothetical protein BC835DRAFT_727228 [Cytidiella melzeri]